MNILSKVLGTITRKPTSEIEREPVLGWRLYPADRKTNAKFIKLNNGWDADPVFPDEGISEPESFVDLEFNLSTRFGDCERFDRARLRFTGACRYRLGGPNDEGWARRQCRFVHLKQWGGFFEVMGDRLLDECEEPWVEVDYGSGTRHFIFYNKENTFECSADDWGFTKL